MSKVSRLVATCAAVAVAALIALPAPAGAAERQAAGVNAQSNQNVGSLEVSSQRRFYRGGGRYYGRRFYGPRYGYGYRPSYGYGYRPYGYYRPYYRPAPFFPFF